MSHLWTPRPSKRRTIGGELTSSPFDVLLGSYHTGELCNFHMNFELLSEMDHLCVCVCQSFSASVVMVVSCCWWWKLTNQSSCMPCGDDWHPSDAFWRYTSWLHGTESMLQRVVTKTLLNIVLWHCGHIESCCILFISASNMLSISTLALEAPSMLSCNFWDGTSFNSQNLVIQESRFWHSIRSKPWVSKTERFDAMRL